MLSRLLSYLATVRFTDVIDILIVAFLIYKVIGYVRKTNSKNLALGIFFLALALWLSEALSLTMISYLLKKTFELGLIAVVILFQPELRRLLQRVGSVVLTGKPEKSTEEERVLSQVVLACTDMAASKTGALIAFERENSLNDVINTGTLVNSDVVDELIKNIFFKNAPLHDGAMIIRENKIAAAGCVLPLTKNTNLSKELGTRHRAGIGLSETCDAIVVIVSEETGAISVAVDGLLKRHLDAQSLEKILRTYLIREETDKETMKPMDMIKNFFSVKKNDKQ